MLKTLLAAAAAIALSAPIAAQAQVYPTYATAGEAQLQGRIASFDGAYALTVDDRNGYVDNVQLHQGTVINPTGLTLEPGMIVSVIGAPDGSVFEANEIDTPYAIEAGIPWFCGHRWDYYGPTVSFGFFFGGNPWWHGGFNSWHGPIAYHRNVFVNTTIVSNRTIVNNRSGGTTVATRPLNRPIGVRPVFPRRIVASAPFERQAPSRPVFHAQALRNDRRR